MGYDKYKQRYVGFYWTLSVRWTGFTDLPEKIEVAAARSWTIRYQRELARRWVNSEGGLMVHEVAIQEKSNDRMTPKMKERVKRVADEHCKDGARLLWVDFSACGGWRSHRFIEEALGEYEIPNMSLEAEPLIVNGVKWDPAEHFSRWRVQEKLAREERKIVVPKALREAIEAVPESETGRFKKIAIRLNSLKVPTLGGGTVWREDNVRKAIENLEEIEADTEDKLLPDLIP